MNENTRARLEAILGPIPDDDALIEKVRALDAMLTRYMREALEHAERAETAIVYEGIARDPMLDVAGLRSIHTDSGDHLYVGDVIQEGRRYRITIEELP